MKEAKLKMYNFIDMTPLYEILAKVQLKRQKADPWFLSTRDRGVDDKGHRRILAGAETLLSVDRLLHALFINASQSECSDDNSLNSAKLTEQ